MAIKNTLRNSIRMNNNSSIKNKKYFGWSKNQRSSVNDIQSGWNKDKQLIIFTDGACKDNGKKYARAGIGVHFPNEESKDISEKFTLTPITNQRAELWAVNRAFNRIVNSKLIDKYDEIIIYSDSKYTIKSLTIWPRIWIKNGWKTSTGKNVLNTDIIVPLYDLIQNYKNKVKFIHVIAHTEKDDPISNGNRRADELANESI